MGEEDETTYIERERERERIYRETHGYLQRDYRYTCREMTL